MAKTNPKYGYYWFAPNGQRPITGSTVATKDTIKQLAKDGATVQQLHDQLSRKNYFGILNEELAVLDAYIQRGYGNWVINEHFS